MRTVHCFRLFAVILAALGLSAQGQNLPALPASDYQGSGAPALNCVIGQRFFRTNATAGCNLYLCTATNTWTQAAGCGATTPATITVGAYASRPGSGTTSGDTYISSDGPYTSVWSGGAWKIFAYGQLMTDPSIPSFAWGTTQGTATSTTTTGPLILTAPANTSDQLRVRDIAVPTAPYSITIKFQVTADTNNYIGAGLSLRDSGSGKLITFSINQLGKVTRSNWTNQTTFSAEAAGAQPLPTGAAFLTFKIYDDNTNRNFYYSLDGGQSYQLYLTEARTAHMTPTHVGIYTDDNQSSSAKPVVLTLLSWAQGVN